MEATSESKARVCFEFEVEKIIGVSVDGNYQVQWAPAWVSKFHLVGCKHLIQEFMLQQQAESNMRVEAENQFQLPNVASKMNAGEECEQCDRQQQTEPEVNAESELQQKMLHTANSGPRLHEALQQQPPLELKREHEPEMQLTFPHQGEVQHSERPQKSSTIGTGWINDLDVVEETDLSNIIIDSMHVSANPSSAVVKNPFKVKNEIMALDRNEYQWAGAETYDSMVSDIPNTTPSQYICYICHTEFSVENDLKTHMAVHGSGTKTSETQQTHRPNFSLGNSNLSAPATSRLMTEHSCTVCEKVFHKAKDLACHFRTHTGEKPYQCPHCDKLFALKHHLNQHVATHTGTKPYSCLQCSYTCSSSSNLIVHMRRHTGEKPYLCEHCGYSSAQKSDLTKHMRTHTGVKRYSCDQCSYSSNHAGHLTRHLSLHKD